MCLVRIVVAGLAGVHKESYMAPGEIQVKIKEFDLKKGLMMAALFPVMSA
jgi:hypothetical protein